MRLAHSRRVFLSGLAGVAALRASGLRAEAIVDLVWRDLLPAGETALPPSLQGVLPHDESAVAAGQPRSSGVRTDWNGRAIRLSGFIVPLDYSGMGVTAFILVPYVGACIHVPPPPANQLVLATTEEPYASGTLFEAVTVTGNFSTASMSTELAQIGYALAADSVEPYR